MALLKIARLGNPVLAQNATAVPEKEFGTAYLKDLVRDMTETMRDAEGVGLAAPQIHESTRVILAEVQSGNGRYNAAELPLTVLINPEIIKMSAHTEDGWEGCLSIPDLRGLVPRAHEIVAKARDMNGEEFEFTAQGFFARIIQHEVDHLNGITFLERMTDLKSLAFGKEYLLYKAT